jgi:PPOX class probable F420-dependent enzyme
MQKTVDTLAPFVHQTTAALTTYRRDGRAVITPVHVAVDGDRLVFRTWHTTGKLKRIRNNPIVELAPSTFRGHVTGRAIRACARVLEGAEARRAARVLGGKYPIIHGLLIPLGHRLMGVRTIHLELRPIEASAAGVDAA